MLSTIIGDRNAKREKGSTYDHGPVDDLSWLSGGLD